MLGQVRSCVCDATPGPMHTQGLRGIDVAQNILPMWLAGTGAPEPRDSRSGAFEVSTACFNKLCGAKARG